MMMGTSQAPKKCECGPRLLIDYLVAFKNVRELRVSLFASHYIRGSIGSPARHFGHFQPTLRCLCLRTWLTNPWDLVVFIGFFPFLEDVTIEMLNPYTMVGPYNPLTPPENEPQGLEPAVLPHFEGPCNCASSLLRIICPGII